jgi:hypothetical protein
MNLALKARLPESRRPVKNIRQNDHFFHHDKEHETLNFSQNKTAGISRRGAELAEKIEHRGVKNQC